MPAEVGKTVSTDIRISALAQHDAVAEKSELILDNQSVALFENDAVILSVADHEVAADCRSCLAAADPCLRSKAHRKILQYGALSKPDCLLRRILDPYFRCQRLGRSDGNSCRNIQTFLIFALLE